MKIFKSWFPPGGGDLDGEVGGGEEGEDLGGDVVAAVVNGCGLESAGNVWGRTQNSHLDDVENEVEDWGEGCEVVLSAGCDSNCVVVVS